MEIAADSRQAQICWDQKPDAMVIFQGTLGGEQSRNNLKGIG
jgi:hypothetical protein